MTTKEQVLEIIEGYKPAYINSNYITMTLDKVIGGILEHIQSEVHEPKIKQLEWEDCWATAFKIDEYELIEYEVIRLYKGYQLKLGDKEILTTSSFKEAKAYAQEHFENLIRGCYE